MSNFERFSSYRLTAVGAGGVLLVSVDKAMGAAGGRGMQNSLRRAQAVGGAVSWRSGPAGTLFTLWVPLKCKGRAASA